MALRTIRSSLCSDFDYAQDDTVEKAQGGSRSGISAGQRKKVAISTTFQESGTRNGNRTHNYPLGGGYYIHLTMQADGFLFFCSQYDHTFMLSL